MTWLAQRGEATCRRRTILLLDVLCVEALVISKHPTTDSRQWKRNTRSLYLLVTTAISEEEGSEYSLYYGVESLHIRYLA